MRSSDPRHPVLSPMLVALSVSFGAGCFPGGASGQCEVDEDCTGRGQVCDPVDSVCVDRTFDPTTTEQPAPSDFSGKPVPFFRGRVCSVTEVASGDAIPVHIEPCLHPCVSVQSYTFKHFFECIGASCSAWIVAWVDADGAGCPPDAFSTFPSTQCVYDVTMDLAIDTNLASGPIVGNMTLEMPFLTNEDMAALAAMGDFSPDAAKARIFQYPQERDRLVPPGGLIRITEGGPTAPANCDGGACPCFDVGF